MTHTAPCTRLAIAASLLAGVLLLQVGAGDPDPPDPPCETEEDIQSFMRVSTTTPNPANAYGNTVLDDATYYVRWMPWSGIYAGGMEQYCFGVYHAGYCLNQPEYAATRDMDWCTTLNPPGWLWDNYIEGEYEISGGYLRNGLGVPMGSFLVGTAAYPWRDTPGAMSLTQRVVNSPPTGKDEGSCLQEDEPWEGGCDVVMVNIDRPGYDPMSTAPRYAPAFEDIELNDEPDGWAEYYEWDPQGLREATPAGHEYHPIVTTGPVLPWDALVTKVREINAWRPQNSPIVWTEGVISITASRESRVDSWCGLGIDPANWEIADTLQVGILNPCSDETPDSAVFFCPAATHGRLGAMGSYCSNEHYFSFTANGRPAGEDLVAGECVDMLRQWRFTALGTQPPWPFEDDARYEAEDYSTVAPLVCLDPCNTPSSVLADVYMATLEPDFSPLPASYFPIRVEWTYYWFQRIGASGAPGPCGSGSTLHDHVYGVSFTYLVTRSSDGSFRVEDFTVESNIPGSPGDRFDR